MEFQNLYCFRLFGQNVNILSTNFKEFHSTKHDMHKDGDTLTEEAAAAGTKPSSGKHSVDLTGIDAFGSSRVLDFTFNQLSSLTGLYGITIFESLPCNFNQITGLPNLFNFTNLKHIENYYKLNTSLSGLSSAKKLSLIMARFATLEMARFSASFKTHLENKSWLTITLPGLFFVKMCPSSSRSPVTLKTPNDRMGIVMQGH